MAKKKADAEETKPDGVAVGETAEGAKAEAPSGEGEGKKRKAPKAKPAEGAATEAGGETPAAPAEGKKAKDAGEKKKKKKMGVPPARGKKLRNQLKNQRQKLEKEGTVNLRKAVSILKGLRRAKFDETVEVHVSLGVDVQQADQLVRGTVPLPYGLGKSVRVVVFCQGDNVAKATAAGADFAGADDLLEKITKQNWLEFDVALATQDMMGKVSRLGKVLGPRGLMPTPKAGTVITGDVAESVKSFKAGKVEYRTDKSGNVHAGVGKVSFDEEKLTANITAFVDAIRAAKPHSVKGHYIRSITICSTMSPGVPVSIS